MPELVLRALEDAVPEPRLAVRLELRQVEVRPAAGALRAARGCAAGRGRSRTATPTSARRRPRSAARPGASRAGARASVADLVVQLVDLLALLEPDRPVDRLGEVPLPVDHVLPGRRVRVLEVGHEDLRARVERVDHHLPVGRAGDLDAPVGRGPRGAGGTRQSPSRTARVSSRKSGSSPSRSRCARACARGEQLLALAAELALQQRAGTRPLRA